ncbi:hypothetical protein ABC733_01730 [Mangrovibacter sp. SLW1]
MHNGNLSFISSHGRPYQLAPAYDVLPMGFAPKAGGALSNELRPVALAEVVNADTWREALALAEKFLAIARCCEGFSANFAPALRPWITILVKPGAHCPAGVNGPGFTA